MVRIGPLVVGRYRAPSPAAPPRPRGGELGASGTTIYSGIITGVDYNTALTGEAGRKVYEQMFKSDGTARAVEKAIILPILGAQRTIEPASDSARDREVAEAVEAALDGMAMTWARTLRHILYMLRYGYYLLELVWEVRDDKLMWAKWAPRPPGTIYRWYTTEDGEPAGVQQRVWKPKQAGFKVIASGSYEFLDIPMDRLMLFTNEREGSNFEGESLGRPMYKHWKMKDTVERIMAIGVEKREIGTETAKMAAGATPEDESKIKAALASLHAAAQGYLTYPGDIVEELTIFGQNGQGTSRAQGFLDHCKREMATSALAEFIAMGSQQGTQAMHRDKTSFFLLALKSLADGIGDDVQRQAIIPFVNLNFQGVTDYPRLKFSRLETRNLQEYAAAIATLTNAGQLTADRVTQEALRAELDLPEMPEEEEMPDPALLPPGQEQDPDQDPRQQPGKPPEPSGREGEETPGEDQEPDPEDVKRNSRRAFRSAWDRSYAGTLPAAGCARELRPAEKRVDYAALETELNAGQERIIRAVAAVQRRQVAKLVDLARGIVERNQPDRVERIEIPYGNELSGAIAGALGDLYHFGRRQAVEEVQAPKSLALDPADEEAVLRFLAARGKALSASMAARLKGDLSLELMRQLRAGTFDAEAMEAKLLDTAERSVTAAARASTSEALNLGRDAGFEQHRDAIAYLELSSVLDRNTCAFCEEHDGDQFAPGSAEAEQLRPPLRDCQGGDLCRCITVAVMAEEAGH